MTVSVSVNVSVGVCVSAGVGICVQVRACGERIVNIPWQSKY